MDTLAFAAHWFAVGFCIGAMLGSAGCAAWFMWRWEP